MTTYSPSKGVIFINQKNIYWQTLGKYIAAELFPAALFLKLNC